MGVEVALCFCIINDRLPGNTVHTGPRTKAVHMEVEKNMPSSKCKSIANLYLQGTELPTWHKNAPGANNQFFN